VDSQLLVFHIVEGCVQSCWSENWCWCHTPSISVCPILKEVGNAGLASSISYFCPSMTLAKQDNKNSQMCMKTKHKQENPFYCP
jgi:hypothetical protein